MVVKSTINSLILEALSVSMRIIECVYIPSSLDFLFSTILVVYIFVLVIKDFILFCFVNEILMIFFVFLVNIKGYLAVLLLPEPSNS